MQERNEESCEGNHPAVGVEPVVNVVVVLVPLRAIAIEVTHIAITTGVEIYISPSVPSPLEYSQG